MMIKRASNFLPQGRTIARFLCQPQNHPNYPSQEAQKKSNTFLKDLEEEEKEGSSLQRKRLATCFVKILWKELGIVCKWISWPFWHQQIYDTSWFPRYCHGDFLWQRGIGYFSTSSTSSCSSRWMGGTKALVWQIHLWVENGVAGATDGSMALVWPLFCTSSSHLTPRPPCCTSSSLPPSTGWPSLYL